MKIDMKIKKETKQQYNKLIKVVNSAEKQAMEFVKKNLTNDSELQLKAGVHRLSV